MYRRILALALLLALALTGCAQAPASVDEACVAATTYPVWQFTCAVTEGTGLHVERVISEPVSCVHDYALSVEQMRILSRSRTVVISGLGLEDFMADVLPDGERCIDASAGIETLSAEAHDHDHDHDHDGHGHDHEHGEADPHLWLDPARAGQMVRNIAAGLSGLYPAYAETFSRNAEVYCAELDKLLEDGRAALSGLSCRELVTFHDGFGYFADAFGLDIAAAMEVEAGSEPPARELEEIVGLLRARDIPAVFCEASGDDAVARLVANETGAGVFVLDLGMGARDYFETLRHDLETVKEALS